MTSVIRGDDDFDTGNIAGGNIASDFTVTATARTWDATLTTTAGAGRYIINCYLKGNGSSTTTLYLSEYSNVDDGFFGAKNYDNGTEITGYSVWNRASTVAMHVTGIVSTSGNFTIGRPTHPSVEVNITWIKIE
jgi:hypothetical protein